MTREALPPLPLPFQLSRLATRRMTHILSTPAGLSIIEAWTR
jgi:hypothetical protein